LIIWLGEVYHNEAAVCSYINAHIGDILQAASAGKVIDLNKGRIKRFLFLSS